MSENQKLNFNFEVQEPKKKNNIVVFFLKSNDYINDDLLTFPYAMKNNLADVKEVSKIGSFKNLILNNKSKKKLLVLGSEIIIGNKLKQDRVVDETVVVSGNSTAMLKVSCCEKNRWSPSVSEDISLSETLLFSKARTNNAEDIYNSQKNNQFRVWEDIDEKFEENEVRSITNSIEEIYRKRKKNVEEIVKYFQPEDDDIGVVLGIGSRLVSIDVFSSNIHLKEYLPRLIRSVALDSFKKTGYKTFLKKKDVYKFLRTIEHSDKRIYNINKEYLGNYIRFNDDLVTGTVLSLDKKIIHFYASLKELSTPPDFKSKVA